MEQIVIEYLNSTYDINVEFNKIYEIGYADSYETSYDLSKELKLYFGLDTDIAKHIVSVWILKIAPEFDFKFFWCDIAFPNINMVMPQTLGLDLISVQPMAEPSGNLVWMDYVVETTVDSNNNGRIYTQEALDEAKSRYSIRNVGELEHPTAENRVDEMLHRWLPIISQMTGTTMS